MKRLFLIPAVGVILATAGCGRPPVEKEIDLKAEVAAIRQADIDFDSALFERDVERFKSLIADDAAFYESSGIVVGPEEVSQAWEVFFDPESGVRLRWSPQRAEVSEDGSLGFTRGEWKMTISSEDDETRVRTGWYVTIWRKNTDGRWQAAVDIGNPKQEPEA